MPRLQSLSHWACLSSKPHPQLYSTQLRQLKVDLTKSMDIGSDVLMAQMKCLSSATGLRCLTLTISDNVDGIETFSLEPIECMKELESLTVHGGCAVPTKQLVLIRRLPSLRTLSLGG
jgi:hypothetical protein